MIMERGVMSNVMVKQGPEMYSWVTPETGSQTSDAALVQLFLSSFARNPGKVLRKFPAFDRFISRENGWAGSFPFAFRDEIIWLMLLTQ